MTTQEQTPERKALRTAMEERQEDLDLTWGEIAQAAGVKVDTIRRVRVGNAPVQQTTRRGIERGLRWKEGSVDAVLAGGRPTPEEASPVSVTPTSAPGGAQMWITLPGGTPVMVPVILERIPGLKGLSAGERGPLLEAMAARMVQAGWEFLYESGQARQRGEKMY